MSKEVLGILRELKGLEWPTKRGGLICAISIFVLSSATITILKKIGIVIDGFLTFCILIAPQIIHLIAWIIKRKYLYDPNILTIAFAIQTEETSREYYREIKKIYREQINTYNLKAGIKIKELPSDVSFSDSKTAEKFIIKKGIRVLVWGNTTEGNIGNAPFSQFNIKVTYQHGVIEKEKQIRFVDDIAKAVQRRMWGIRKPDSFHHLIVVSGNVFEISLYTLGACLATVPNINYLLRSVDIFEKLDNILKTRKQDINFPNLQFVKQKVRSHLQDAYTFLLIYIWGHTKDLDKSIEYAEKAIKLDENNFYAHQNMAVYQWLKGNQGLARHHTARAWHIRPGHPLPRFNRAFFFMFDQRYEQGLDEYKKIEYVGDTNIIDVIEFIEKEYEKVRDNHGLLFAAGWLNIQYADQVRGNSQLQDFLSQAENDSTYEILVTEAKRVLAPRMN